MHANITIFDSILQPMMRWGELTAKGLAMTRMMCANPQLNELDNTISEMLKEGAQVDLTANQLTLATAKQTLTYKLADLMN